MRGAGTCAEARGRARRRGLWRARGDVSAGRRRGDASGRPGRATGPAGPGFPRDPGFLLHMRPHARTVRISGPVGGRAPGRPSPRARCSSRSGRGTGTTPADGAPARIPVSGRLFRGKRPVRAARRPGPVGRRGPGHGSRPGVRDNSGIRARFVLQRIASGSGRVPRAGLPGPCSGSALPDPQGARKPRSRPDLSHSTNPVRRSEKPRAAMVCGRVGRGAAPG